MQLFLRCLWFPSVIYSSGVAALVGPVAFWNFVWNECPYVSAGSFGSALFSVNAMTDRRKLQNYEHLPHCLTDELWEEVKSSNRFKATNALFNHLWQLGLRCPTEGTFNVVFAILEICSSKTQPMSAFERYSSLQSLKQDWKKFKHSRRNSDHQYVEYCEVLPRAVQDLPSEYYLTAFAQNEPAPTRS